MNSSDHGLALITGASSGVGVSFAHQLAQRPEVSGFWLVARREARLTALAAELEREYGKASRILALDLATDEGLEALSAALETERPRINWLVNSAGFGKVGSTESIGLADNRAMCRLNVEALVAVTLAALPLMPEAGRIVQLSSIAGFMPQPGFNTYAATKAFVLRFTRALNRELRPRGITATAVCPGPMETEFFDVAGRSGGAEQATGMVGRIKSLGVESVDHVVARAIRRAARGRDISVSSLSGRFLRVIAHLVPTAWQLSVMRLLGFGG